MAGKKDGTSPRKNEPQQKAFGAALKRDASKGMKFKSIVAGFGTRGEKIRYSVMGGALCLPAESLELMEAELEQTGSGKDDVVGKKYDLPSVEVAVRPSADGTLLKQGVIVTELRKETQMLPPRLDPATGMYVQPSPIQRTVAVNRRLAASESGGDGVERIRGGGGDDDTSKPAGEEKPSTATTSSITGSAPTATTSSSTATASNTPSQTPSSETTKTEPTVVPLSKTPSSQWQQHVPGPHDEVQVEIKTEKPAWYSSDKIADLERTMLPEWFDNSASHRTPKSYMDARERIIQMSAKLENRYVTPTLVRRTIAGDVGSLHRLHAFLVAYSFINEDAINDSTPTAACLRVQLNESPSSLYKRAFPWTEHLQDTLTEAVVEESNKRQKTADAPLSIDWKNVAARVGNGAKPSDCEREFLALPLQASSQEQRAEGAAAAPQPERSITPDVTTKPEPTAAATSPGDAKEALMHDILACSKPEVIKAATDASLKVSGNLAEAQAAARSALVASKAVETARSEEDKLIQSLAELHEQRLRKLENRMAVMDDVECLLETERVALELERRDLYTARCRHWFGGGK